MKNVSKTKVYTNVVSFDIIGIRLANFLQEKRYEVSYAVDEKKSWVFIQTRRISELKQEKCKNISIQGNREECAITIDDGEWNKNTIDSSKSGNLIPYKGIYADEKKLSVPIILEKQVFDFLDKIT
jgi:hypothetical protein